MTKLLIPVFVASLLACRPQDSVAPQETDLRGAWRLVEASYSVGDANQIWYDVEEGYYYHFTENGSFSSDRFPECSGDRYDLKDGRLTLVFSCGGAEREYVERIEFREGDIFMSPVSPAACFEGCNFRFTEVVLYD